MTKTSNIVTLFVLFAVLTGTMAANIARADCSPAWRACINAQRGQLVCDREHTNCTAEARRVAAETEARRTAANAELERQRHRRVALARAALRERQAAAEEEGRRVELARIERERQAQIAIPHYHHIYTGDDVDLIVSLQGVSFSEARNACVASGYTMWSAAEVTNTRNELSISVGNGINNQGVVLSIRCVDGERHTVFEAIGLSGRGVAETVIGVHSPLSSVDHWRRTSAPGTRRTAPNYNAQVIQEMSGYAVTYVDWIVAWGGAATRPQPSVSVHILDLNQTRYSHHQMKVWLGNSWRPVYTNSNSDNQLRYYLTNIFRLQAHEEDISWNRLLTVLNNPEATQAEFYELRGAAGDDMGVPDWAIRRPLGLAARVLNPRTLGGELLAQDNVDLRDGRPLHFVLRTIDSGWYVLLTTTTNTGLPIGNYTFRRHPSRMDSRILSRALRMSQRMAVQVVLRMASHTGQISWHQATVR